MDENMSLSNLYNGTSRERDENGISTTYTQTGTKTECETWEAAQVIGATYAGYGKLVSTNVYQLGGDIYAVAAKYQNANGTSGSTGNEVVPPDYTFGEFSATMDCSMLSAPLEQHPAYRMCWNYYLAARDDAYPAPPWATTATTPELGANSTQYKWLSAVSELPVGKDEDGHTWSIVQNVTMGGYQSYDRALYTQTESARYRTREEAVAATASYANTIGTPINDPGSAFSAGNWKCDHTNVEWTGEYWRGTLTWTYSPDGWNRTLYPNDSPSST